jgi:hypothetical protein
MIDGFGLSLCIALHCVILCYVLFFGCVQFSYAPRDLQNLNENMEFPGVNAAMLSALETRMAEALRKKWSLLLSLFVFAFLLFGFSSSLSSLLCSSLLLHWCECALIDWFVLLFCSHTYTYPYPYTHLQFCCRRYSHILQRHIR